MAITEKQIVWLNPSLPTKGRHTSQLRELFGSSPIPLSILSELGVLSRKSQRK